MTSANNNQIQEVLSGSKPVLLDFYAEWCGPCKSLAPTIDTLSEKYKDKFEILKVDVDQHKELAMKYGIRSIPALLFFENGAVKERLVGNQAIQTLENKISSYLN
ncbi:MAG: thioredoxin 1 [Limisphaerales bacterium]|jgi:thioredoxin 1